MLVKYFDEYSSTEMEKPINEYRDYKDIKFNNKSKIDIYKGFEKLGYSKCLGIFTWSYKTFNNWGQCKPIEDFLRTNLFDIANQISDGVIDIKNDIVDRHDIEIDCYSPNYAYDHHNLDFKDKHVSEYFQTVGEENVVKIRENRPNDKKDYYVFWNPIKKYFYFVTLDPKLINDDMRILFNYYVLLKTERNAIDILENRFGKKKERIQQREKEREEWNYWDNVKNEYYDKLKEDYKNNKENYKKVDTLPENVEKCLFERDDHIFDKVYQFKEIYEKDGYFEENISNKSGGDYGTSTITSVYIVNNKDFTDGYVYEKYRTIRHYMGD